MNPRTGSPLLACLIAACLLIAAVAEAQHTIVVTTTAQHSATECTLSDAINAMNVWQPIGACPSGLGRDTILLPAGDYVLSTVGVDEEGELTGLPYATRPIAIVGEGRGVTVIRRNPDPSTPQFRIFKFQAPMTIRNLTIENGSMPHNRGGGAILVETFNWIDPFDRHHRLVANIDNVEFKNNYASSGGAIADTGFYYGPYVEFNVTGSRFVGNRHSNAGGAIYVSPESLLNVRDSYFEDNGGGEWGGGVGTQQHSSAAFNISDSEFVNNHAVQGGGAIHGRSPSLTRVIARNNRARDGGGALGSYGGRPVIVDSTFTGNHARKGGAIDLIAGSIEISGTTFSANVATDFTGGAIVLDDRLGTSAIVNSTFSSNRAVERGGAIYLYGGGLRMNNVTITGNVSSNGSGVSLGWWGGSTLTLGNSILAGNTRQDGSAHDLRVDPQEQLISLGHNLIGSDDGNENRVTAAGDRVGTASTPLDAGLMPLADNGGPAPTHALQPNSLAFDAGSPLAPGTAGACEPLDQRGMARPGLGSSACDIGAYERDNSFALTVTIEGTGHGSVTGPPGMENCGQPCTMRFPAGSDVWLTVHVSITSVFAGWGGACSGASPVCIVTMNGDQNVTATIDVAPPPAAGTTLVLDTASGTVGDPIALSARLTRTADGTTLAGREIRFVLAAGTFEPLGSATTNADGVAVLTTTDLRAGVFLTSAFFDGEPGVLLASEGHAEVAVAKATTTMTLTSSQTPALIGQPITLTARLTWPASAGTPTGPVSFFITDGGRPLGLGDVRPDGTVQIEVVDLAIGTHGITALYHGDLRFNGSSSAITQEVMAVPTSEPRPPLARIRRVNPGNLRSGGAGVIVPLSGERSLDPEGGALTYAWSVGTQTGSGVSFSPLLTPGDHVVTLVVTDETGLTGTDSLTVRVKDLRAKK